MENSSPNPLIFPETELIITPKGTVYHIDLNGEQIADDVIVVGDQDRVELIAKFFEKIEHRSSHREFKSCTGTFNGKRITVLSTGIGTDNIDIVLNELDAAVNIDLITRTEKPKKRSLNIIRLGTSGALQAHIPVNGIVVSSGAFGIDGLLPFYKGWERVCEQDFTHAFIQQLNWNRHLPYPYFVEANSVLLTLFSEGNYPGITVTAPGFYGPQGRQLRNIPALDQFNERLAKFSHNNQCILNFEMETSALYGLGKLLGHRCLTLCVIIANRARKEFTKDYQKSVETLVESALQRLTR